MDENYEIEDIVAFMVIASSKVWTGALSKTVIHEGRTLKYTGSTR